MRRITWSSSLSFIKITTIHPTGRETTGITQQAHVTAREAFDNRLARLNGRPQGFKADRHALTIRIDPTEIVDYSQLLEYAETIDGFDNGDQPGLFESLAVKPCS